MRQSPIAGLKPAIALFSALLIFSFSQAQNRYINWANDTISKADAMGGKSTYVNTVRGSGQLATEKIKIPVNKLKEILDACAANNITEISVMIVSIRKADVARFRKNNPEVTATEDQIKGRQMLIFKVPRRAFAAASSSKINLSSTNPLMLSLASMGLIKLETSYLGLPAGDGDLYFGIGTICPPPAACDD